MPMSTAFKSRLFPIAREIAMHYGTPFHIYDEAGIHATGQALKEAFQPIDGFREYFAVKALPNPHILSIMYQMGFGFDCSSIAELHLSRNIGATGHDLMFTSNNTSPADFRAAAAEGGAILNLDDISLIDKVRELPDLMCFRYNPGPRRKGNRIIGNPVESKYGVAHDQILDAYRRAQNRGVRRFGIHAMLASNASDYRYMVQTTRMLLEMVAWIADTLAIRFEFINIGGGLGIPYKPGDPALDLGAMAREINILFTNFRDRHAWMPKLFMESGRYMTGPHGVLVVTAINRKNTYRTYVGVDASMSALMRPGIYGAYHHIDIIGKPIEGCERLQPIDVVGSLCENNDKFAIQRPLPPIGDGDLLCIQDTGAHGHAMGFNYNGQLRPKELLLRKDGTVALIRRAETLDDYLATLTFPPNTYQPSQAARVARQIAN
jgi:diaminopimelate decarboxylase